MDVETIIQGGAVGISILLIGLLYKKDQNVATLIGNHLTSETKAKLKQAKALQRLSDVIESYFIKNK